ncbi:hypothetical protein BDZ91DRAFT_762731 [Kalaharituber pfeilii]|nr:hypothetical protein BDZ91DRAFT_762731 [Kalaharituber pfeilii]
MWRGPVLEGEAPSRPEDGGAALTGWDCWMPPPRGWWALGWAAPCPSPAQAQPGTTGGGGPSALSAEAHALAMLADLMAAHVKCRQLGGGPDISYIWASPRPTASPRCKPASPPAVRPSRRLPVPGLSWRGVPPLMASLQRQRERAGQQPSAIDRRNMKSHKALQNETLQAPPPPPPPVCTSRWPGSPGARASLDKEAVLAPPSPEGLAHRPQSPPTRVEQHP